MSVFDNVAGSVAELSKRCKCGYDGYVQTDAKYCPRKRGMRTIYRYGLNEGLS